MNSAQPQIEALHKLEAQNKILTEQNKALMGQLELTLSNVQRLEKMRVLQQSQLNKVETQNRALDVTISTLGSFINSLIEDKVDVEIPDDVQRILSHLNFSERVKSEVKPQQNNLLKMFQKSPDKMMQKSLSMGKINLPPNSEHNRSRTNSLSQNKDILPNLETTPSNSAEKISKFFSNSHHNILQQKHNSQNNLLNNAKIDITVQEFEHEEISNALTKKIDFDANKISPTNSEDSGVGTPNSPKETHPLSNCDVTFTFNGTKELKSIKNFKNLRQCSPDILSK